MARMITDGKYTYAGVGVGISFGIIFFLIFDWGAGLHFGQDRGKDAEGAEETTDDDGDGG